MKVSYHGAEIGTISVSRERAGIRFVLHCDMQDEVLRCYGSKNGKNLLIGIPAPEQGEFYLSRLLSFDTLRKAGWKDTLPERYYLAKEPEKRQTPEQQKILRTGDALFDQLIASGAVSCEQNGDKLQISCPFEKEKPFPLAFAALICRVSGGRAELLWPNPQ